MQTEGSDNFAGAPRTNSGKKSNKRHELQCNKPYPWVEMVSTPQESKQVLVLAGWATSAGKIKQDIWSRGRGLSFVKAKPFHSLAALTSPAPTSTKGLSTQTWASLLYSHPSPHPPLSPNGKLKKLCRDHHSATRQLDPRSRQVQEGLSVTEDQRLCKPLRHSTLPAGSLFTTV